MSFFGGYKKISQSLFTGPLKDAVWILDTFLTYFWLVSTLIVIVSRVRKTELRQTSETKFSPL